MKTKKHSHLRDFYQKFKKHKLANFGLFVVLLEIVLVIVLPMVLDLKPYEIYPAFDAAPSAEHILGTDNVGRDIFARVIYGGQVSLLVGFASTIISVIVGLPLGLIAGYYRGWSESVIMRLADIFLSFPSMILTIVMVAIFGSSIPVLILLIGLLAWPQPCRLVYSRVLSVRKMEYVEAAKAEGRSEFEIIIKEVLPNSVAPLWMSIAFMVSSAMITESALSFLGAGVQMPMASWGNIVRNATNVIVLYMYPWEWLPAGIMLIITVVCINFVGEGVRDALDPKMKR
ncbi:MAG: ABC transporter permease [Erysipelotrichaceae bacterium]|nr:ABC transporter permease [Erysipelotrichaceae bacterium]